MKIHKISCNHFAGLNGKKLELTDGLNVVCENNEEGKSTIIDLMYQTLFQGTSKPDKAFKARSFPSRADGVETSVIDGEIIVEKDGNVSTVKKTWSSKSGKGTEYYSDTQGASSDVPEEIESKLSEILGGTSGVYNEIVFDSKRFKSETIRNLFEAGQDTQKNVSEVLQVTKDSADGVSMNKVESVIEVKDKLFGSNWDYDTESIIDRSKKIKEWGNIPKRCSQLELVMDTQAKVEQYEVEKSAIYSELDEKDSKRGELQELLNNFGVVTKAIDDKESLAKARKIFKELEDRRDEYDKALEVRDKAGELRSEYKAAVIIEQYVTASEKKAAYESKNQELDALIPVQDKDVSKVNKLYQDIDKLNTSGNGINVTASVEQLGDRPVKISYLDGSSALEGSGELTIDQIVEVCIPDVLKLTIKPNGFDISKVKERIDSKAGEIQEAFGRFDVDGIAALESKKELYEQLQAEVKRLELDYKNYLEKIGKTWETLEEEYRILDDSYKSADNMSVDAVKVRIVALCGEGDIEGFCRINDRIIQDYKDDDIDDKIKETKKIVDKLADKVDSDGDIPEAYQGITDSKAYTDEMVSKIGALESEIDDLEARISEKNEKIKELNDDLRNNQDYDFSHFEDDYYEEIKRLNDSLEENKREGKIWHDLKLKFDTVKAGRPSVPHDGFDKDFLRFMAYITDGSVSAAAMNDDLSVDVVSGVNKMAYEILSDGTAETVALAFRLAMLKQVFPSGGGFAVFDDPLVNMDDGRKQRSIELIEEFAKDNQVIFVTCHSEYKADFKGAAVCSIQTLS